MKIIKRFLPRTLFGRSLIILIAPVLLIQIVTTYMFFERHWTKMTDRLAFAVAGEMAIIADQIEKRHAETGSAAEIVKRIGGYAAQSLDLLISYEAGAEIDRQDEDILARSIVAETLHEAVEAQVRRAHTVNVDIEEKWVEVSLQLEQGVLRVSLPQRRLFSSSGYIFLLWMIGTSIALLAIAILFMRNQIRPIRRLAVVAEKVGRGQDIPSSFKPEGAREVRQAARSFLDMHQRVKRQVEQRTAMLSGISHDLRTPLTRMKLQVAMMEKTPDSEAIEQDIEDMQKMVDAYLDFTKGEGQEELAYIDLSEFIRDIADNIRREGGTLKLDTDKRVSMTVRPVALRRALTNLVGNACKYGSHAWVTVKKEESDVDNEVAVIIIDDDGEGLPEELYEEVFKPFYRAEESRNPSTGGVGLGLPIAKDIILGHGGHISLDKSPHGGLRVRVEIPL